MITGLLLVITIGFVAGLFVSPPSATGVLGGLVPEFSGSGSVLLAAGMVGATVMPHAVYLHSALARDRFGPAGRALLGATKADVGLAMVVAGTVNLAMVLLAATALSGRTDGSSLDGVHAAVGDALGGGIALLFAIGLLASGLASTAVGCYAGAVVMEGLLRRRVPLVARRLVTLLPAIVELAAGTNPTRALVLSQVVLSFGIPFALVPLVLLTSRRSVMGADVNGRATSATAWAITAVVVALNVALIVV
jgi:manganese transport protein